MIKQHGDGRLEIFAFIDALGWEVLRSRRFMEEELPHRMPARSVLGYSSACVPSILTGQLPRDHGHWSFFYCSPTTSPLRSLRLLSAFPKFIRERGRVRRWLSRAVARWNGFSGYFQLYNLPFEHAHEFDYCEKRDLFAPHGIQGAPSIFDQLRAQNVPFHMSNWRRSEAANLTAARQAIDAAAIRFCFLYLPDLDGALHAVGKDDTGITSRIAAYEQQLREILRLARQRYGEVRITVISDHGMAHVVKTLDLQAVINRLPLKFSRDYVAAYDSTMARFWLRSPQAKQQLADALRSVRGGRLLDDAELAELGCDFPQHRYGELIFLMDPGGVIVPSHMGLTAPRGMHGYHPDHPDSDAVMLSSHAPAFTPKSICDFHGLMLDSVAA